MCLCMMFVMCCAMLYGLRVVDCMRYVCVCVQKRCALCLGLVVWCCVYVCFLV